jgi:hypothetical protein
MASFTLVVDAPPLLPGALLRHPPEGVTITHAPMMLHRSGDLNVTLNFAVHISFAGGATAAIVAAWVCRSFLGKRFNFNPRINDQALPSKEAEAAKMITDAIREEKESADQGRGKPPKERK